MRRRNLSGLTFVTSSPSRKTLPEVGSMRRLIIFIVVALPHPDGPTSTTISPAGICLRRFSTDGWACEGKSFVRRTRGIITSRRWLVRKPLPVMQPPRVDPLSHDHEQPLEEEGQHNNSE